MLPKSPTSLEPNPQTPAARDQFWIPQNTTYLCGHSLGLQPKSAASHVDQILSTWKTSGIEGFFEGTPSWMQLGSTTKSLLAPIVGAKDEEVVVMNALTVNLHLLLSHFYQPTSERTKILIAEKAFPSDQYACASHIRSRGLDPDQNLIRVPHAKWLETLDEHHQSIQLVLVEYPHYLTGEVYDLKAITQKAHQIGALVGGDCAHGVGNLELKLHDWEIDFAVWCHYKFMNSGPGAIGGAFIHQNHLQKHPKGRLEGWWGNQSKTRFEMRDEMDPCATAESWQLSTPSILSLACLNASLELFHAYGIQKVFQRREALSELLFSEMKKIDHPNLEILTPLESHRHGATLCFSMGDQTKKLFQHFQKNKVIVDYREPGLIRVAGSPLYTTETDIQTFINTIHSFS